MDSPCLKAVIHGVAAPIAAGGGACFDVRASHPSHRPPTGISAEKPSLSISQKNPHRRPSFSFRPSILPRSRRRPYKPAVGGGDVVLMDELGEKKNAEKSAAEEEQNGNWVMKILRVRSLSNGGEKSCNLGESQAGRISYEDENHDQESTDCDECPVDYDDNVEFDRDSFSKLLWRVSLKEAKLYAKMSYLGNLAYSIPQIKPRNLLRYHRLCFVTSSLEKKGQEQENRVDLSQETEKKDERGRISASAAYRIAASAASYLQSHTKSILPFKTTIGRRDEEVASLMATTDSVTSVVAAKEEVKQAVADDLRSTRLSPCEWFACDDDQNATRFFVIQGSESLASWQANLLFEPTQFEGTPDVLVHRGIYEAAKGIYEQMLPEVRAHLKSHGRRASFRFTGHSLGGSLSLLINLMLLTRGDAPCSSLLPVITFGSPTIMCGGDRLLQKLGLPQSHLQSIMMHRDIVPRAFSCSYPNRVAEFLKAVNASFRNHPCLNNQKLLYAPMGELLILQPDEKFSPSHHLLPSGSGLYSLTCSVKGEAAKTVFLNSPHPLEILSGRSAYGSGGTIQRDHDMNSYRKSIRNVIREEMRRVRKAKRKRVWWPVTAGVYDGSTVLGKLVRPAGNTLAGMFHGGKESVKRLTLVGIKGMHLFLVFLLPAPLLILRAFSVI